MSETTPINHEHRTEVHQARNETLKHMGALSSHGPLPLEKARHVAAWIANTPWSTDMVRDNGFLPDRTEWSSSTSHDRGAFTSHSFDTGRPESTKTEGQRQAMLIHHLKHETDIAETLFDNAPDHFSNPENIDSTTEIADMVNSVIHNGKRSLISDITRENLEQQSESLVQLLENHQDDSQEWSNRDRWELKAWESSAQKSLKQLGWLAFISRFPENVELDETLRIAMQETSKRRPKSWLLKDTAPASEFRQFANDLLVSTAGTIELHRIIRTQIAETLQPTIEVTGLSRSDLQRLSIKSLVGWRDFTDALRNMPNRDLTQHESGIPLTDLLLDAIDELEFLEAQRQHEESTMKK